VDYVTSLETEAGDNSVERTSFKVKGLSLTPYSLLSCAQTQEIIARLLQAIVQLKHNLPNLFAIN
jgi:hypothetical protein